MAQNQCISDLKTLQRLCRLTNRKAFSLNRRRDTCIFTAATLRDVLDALGVPAEMMRVEAVGVGRKGAVILGSDGDGLRLPAAAPGMWHGHVAVVADRRFLLDPTFDQIPGCKPFTGDVTDEWLSGEKPLWWVDGVLAKGFPGYEATTATRYFAYPGRGGWKSAPDFRISRRRELVAEIVAAWQASS